MYANFTQPRVTRSFVLFPNKYWAYLGVRTCELFLCFVPFFFLGFIVLTSLFSLFYVTGEFNRFSSYTEDEPKYFFNLRLLTLLLPFLSD